MNALVNLPKVRWKKYCQMTDEIYRLIDIMLNRVIIRLGDMVLQVADDHFLCEAVRLDDYSDWRQAELEFRLHCSPSVALRNIVMNPDQDRRIDPVSLLRELGS